MDDDVESDSAEVIEFPKERIVRWPRLIADSGWRKEKYQELLRIVMELLRAG